MVVDRSMIDVIPDPIFIHDDEGAILEVNRQACEHLGYAYDELVGRRIWDIAVNPNPGSVMARWAKLGPGEIAAFDGEHGRADGTTFPIRVHVGRIETDADPMYLATVRDVTDRVRRERELERQNDRLEQFASVVSHDLRNPLNVMTGRLRLARETGDLDHLEPAQRAVDRMEQLITDLLTMAREGKGLNQLEAVDLAGIVEECWETVETGEATIRVESDHVVMADPGRLAQLLENLFGNAVEHGDSTVSVVVGDLADGFYVEDTGPGIPAADRQRVFQSGYSATASGTGFGLAIVADIVDAHGWQVSAVAGEDGGARFEIRGVTTAP